MDGSCVFNELPDTCEAGEVEGEAKGDAGLLWVFSSLLSGAALPACSHVGTSYQGRERDAHSSRPWTVRPCSATWRWGTPEP